VNTVYLINLSFGLAGIERRFANLWRVLDQRRVVSPVLVIPSALAGLLRDADLFPADAHGVIVIPEPRFFSWLGHLRVPPRMAIAIGMIRTRVAGIGYRKVWQRIADDPRAIVHIGMNTSAVKPPDVPAVYECVDANLEQFDTMHFRRASKHRCIVHCQTDRIRSALDVVFRARSPRWKTITNPTYFAHYEDSAPAQDRDPRQIAFVGRLASEKNPLLFIDAVARARQRGSDCKAIMLGEGPLRKECEARIRSHGLQSAVSIDFVANPAEVLRRSAIYVTLQTGDNYGSQSLLEAMGAGCAIIASDVGETKNIVTEETGVRVPLTVEAVADPIERLIASPEATRKRGLRASRIARTTYSADTYAAFLESVYELAQSYFGADGRVDDGLLSTIRHRDFET
jgi:glycosyltransferase involved in cell wall biosynthesis